MMQVSPQIQILWLTNLPAHYRFPIWTRIAQVFDLKVAFLLKEKNWRNWTVPSEQNWRHEFLSLNSINVKEYDFIPSVRGAKKILRNVDLLIIGGWETPFYIRILFLAKKRGIPVIQIYESTADSQRFKKGLIQKIRSAFFHKADLIVTFGPASTKAVEATGVSSDKIMALFNPIDVNWFHSSAKNHRISLPLGHHYVYVGQLIERKNVANIIRSFAAVRNESDTLTIAGDGPLAPSLQDLAESLRIADSVKFVGHLNQAELAKLYAVSNTCVLASTNEVWGLVVNEALASGLHVVVSDLCGVAEFVRDMRGVYVCSPDPDSLKVAMEASAQQWSEHVLNPEILKYTPEKFADAFIRLIFLKLNDDN
jgi:glycosyltransferase involved in cell wall biosynthesis